jgi:hypothetical protein
VAVTCFLVGFVVVAPLVLVENLFATRVGADSARTVVGTALCFAVALAGGVIVVAQLIYAFNLVSSGDPAQAMTFPVRFLQLLFEQPQQFLPFVLVALAPALACGARLSGAPVRWQVPVVAIPTALLATPAILHDPPHDVFFTWLAIALIAAVSAAVPLAHALGDALERRIASRVR